MYAKINLFTSQMHRLVPLNSIRRRMGVAKCHRSPVWLCRHVATSVDDMRADRARVESMLEEFGEAANQRHAQSDNRGTVPARGRYTMPIDSAVTPSNPVVSAELDWPGAFSDPMRHVLDVSGIETVRFRNGPVKSTRAAASDPPASCPSNARSAQYIFCRPSDAFTPAVCRFSLLFRSLRRVTGSTPV